MVFRAWWTEQRFEEWFQDRFDRWIAERLGEEFDQRAEAWADGHFRDRFETLFDQGMQAWADNQFEDRFEALFAVDFKSGINAWKDKELKKGFDAWVEHWFDTLFTVWANTWADGDDFRGRFAVNFAAQFADQLDREVKARVANEINTLIDNHIEQWLLAVRGDLLKAALPTPPASAPAQPDSEDVQPASAPSSDGRQPPGTDPTPRTPPHKGETTPAEMIVTAAELAEFLATDPLQPRQIRKLLRGKEIPGGRPYTYSTGRCGLYSAGAQGSASQEPGGCIRKASGHRQLVIGLRRGMGRLARLADAQAPGCGVRPQCCGLVQR
ncbi:hypothetical protein AB0M50_28210 [Nonomuraea fuscirosea]|uniref:hypothetical protein n=1 Tax=Nonomuraea fuscirosea TaxID=1291556 RepID=UPI003424295B